MSQVTVRVPGTTANCGPGFDAVGIACSIYNEIKLTLLPGRSNQIEIIGQGKGQIPFNYRNISFQSVKIVFEQL